MTECYIITCHDWLLVAVFVGANWIVNRICGFPYRDRWVRWRMTKWDKAKIIGYWLNRRINEIPVMRKHGKYEIVEQKDVEQRSK